MAKIELSSFFNLSLEEAQKGERLPLETRYRVILPKEADKDEVVASMLEMFKKEGDLISFRIGRLVIKEEVRQKLEFFLRESIDAITEKKLEEGLFTVWRGGEKMAVLKRKDGPPELDNLVVKVARSDKNYEKDVLPGYSIAKNILSYDFGITMTLAKKIRMNVTDSAGVPRYVFVPHSLIQERVIVAKDIFDVADGEVKRIISSIIVKKRSHSEAVKDERVRQYSTLMNKIKCQFQEWNDAIGLLGIFDKDCGLIAGMDRNYGFRVPKGFIPEGKRERDWGIKDYSELKAGKRTEVTGFDFDSFALRSGASTKKDRVPDVFEKEILEDQERILKQILIKK